MENRERRRFLKNAVGAGAAVLLTAGGLGGARAKEKKDDDDVSPTEDLMREHGVLRRILIVYGEVIRRLGANQQVTAEPLARAAQIVRAFIEDYHERDEEQFIFPRFQKAGVLTDLVAVLLAQHQAGRKLTADIQRLATTPSLSSAANRRELAASLSQFVRMYEAHAAREDTVLFPAFGKLIGEKELHQLMETFEQKEKALPMGDFEKMVAAVGEIEKSFGLYELAGFTPK